MRAPNQQPRTSASPRFERIEPPAYQITSRDLDFLETLGRHEILQSTHFEALFPDASPDNLRCRFYAFFHAGLVARPEAKVDYLLRHRGSLAMAYVLTDAGAQLIAETRGVLFTHKPDELKLGQLLHRLEISDVQVALEAACRRSPPFLVEPLEDILTRAPSATRIDPTPATWQVELHYRGVYYTFRLTPDRIFALAHRERVLRDPRTRKYFFLEVDRGTMPVVRQDLYYTSILRKYLTYVATYHSNIHSDRFAMTNMRVLFVGKTKKRIDNMITAFQEHMIGSVSPQLFLFADHPTLVAHRDVLHYPWLDGEGKKHHPKYMVVVATSLILMAITAITLGTTFFRIKGNILYYTSSLFSWSSMDISDITAITLVPRFFFTKKVTAVQIEKRNPRLFPGMLLSRDAFPDKTIAALVSHLKRLNPSIILDDGVQQILRAQGKRED